MICEKCGKVFEIDWRKDKETIKKHPVPKFCSRKCSNSRKFTEEAKKKKSESAKKWANEHPDELNKRIELNKVALIKASRQWQENRKAFLFSQDFDSLSFDLKRKRILLEQENKCACCGLSEWMGKPITLEIDHKDGNNKNNTRTNLEGLCPNCHSNTPTWRGRNLLKKKITDKEIIDAFFETGNIRQCLLKVGLTPKGYNYQRVKKIISTLQI